RGLLLQHASELKYSVKEEIDKGYPYFPGKPKTTSEYHHVIAASPLMTRAWQVHHYNEKAVQELTDEEFSAKFILNSASMPLPLQTELIDDLEPEFEDLFEFFND